MCLALCAAFRDLELRCENKDQILKYEQQESTAKTYASMANYSTFKTHIRITLKFILGFGLVGVFGELS
jgi:hypothetical protein